MSGMKLTDWVDDFAAEAKDEADFRKMGILQAVSAHIAELEEEVARCKAIIKVFSEAKHNPPDTGKEKETL